MYVMYVYIGDKMKAKCLVPPGRVEFAVRSVTKIFEGFFRIQVK